MKRGEEWSVHVNGHRKDRGCQDLELARDLERRGVQVASSNVLHAVLQGVQHRGYRHLPAVSREHCTSQLLKYIHDGGRLGSLRVRHDLVQRQRERDRQFDDFV